MRLRFNLRVLFLALAISALMVRAGQFYACYSEMIHRNELLRQHLEKQPVPQPWEQAMMEYESSKEAEKSWRASQFDRSEG